MKTLILYYSYSGTTEKLAKVIAEELGAETERIIVANGKKRDGVGKYAFGGMQAVFKKEPKIKPLTVHPEDYDLIVIGTPVWAATFAPAIRTVLSSNSFTGKKTAFFYTHQGGPGHTEADLKETLQSTDFIGCRNFGNAVQNPATAEQQARKWCSELKQA